MMTLRRRLAWVTCVAALCAGFACRPQTTEPKRNDSPAAANLGLSMKDGGRAPGWFLAPDGRANGYSAALDTSAGPQGSASLRLQSPAAGGHPRDSFGDLLRGFRATPYRGRQIRFRARVRVESAAAEGSAGAGIPARAQLWLRVDRPGHAVGFFNNMVDRPITSAAWSSYEIVGEVPADAESISLGLLLFGEGRAWLAAPTFEAIGRIVQADEPPRPLSTRGRENLVAFARLLGVVRYFHPSDQAAATDWSRFALTGVERVEPASGPADLAQRLNDLFLPIAPSVKIFPTGRALALAAGESLVPPPGAHVLMWRHFGVGLGRGPYSSQRIDAAQPQVDWLGRPVRLVPPPADKPLEIDLSGGVSARVPLAVYALAGATLPPVAQGAALPLPSKPKGFIPSGNDRETRLADVILAWNVFEHFYPYFDDVTSAAWRGELSRALDTAATDRDENAFSTTLSRLLAALHDGHANAQMMRAAPTFRLPLLWAWVDDQLVVTDVDASGGADVRRGDVVTAIEGQPVRKAIAAKEQLISASTPQWRRLRAVDELREGAETEVRLDLRREGAGTIAVTVRRSISSATPDAPAERRPAKLSEVSPGIWYFDLTRSRDDDWNRALNRLATARGIVFDLRGYPQMENVFLQHLIDRPVDSAQMRVPVFVRPDREGMTFQSEHWTLKPLAPRLTGNVAFLTDARAISYAETCLGVVEFHHLGEIVGSPTAGTNGDINPFTLPGGYRINWTGMQVLKQDGSPHQGIGILPTVPIAPTLAGIRDGRDEVLEKAIALLSSKARKAPQLQH